MKEKGVKEKQRKEKRSKTLIFSARKPPKINRKQNDLTIGPEHETKKTTPKKLYCETW